MVKIANVGKPKTGYANFVHLKEDFETYDFDSILVDGMMAIGALDL